MSVGSSDRGGHGELPPFLSGKAHEQPQEEPRGRDLGDALVNPGATDGLETDLG